MSYLNMEEFRKIYADWKASGQSLKTFTKAMGMAPSTFEYWKSKLEKSTEVELSRQGSFVKLGNQQQGVRQPASPAIQTPALCEIVYPNGVMLRITSDLSVEDLRTLITFSR